MNRKETYGESLAVIKRVRDELEERHAELDLLEAEVEEEYVNTVDQSKKLDEKLANADRTNEYYLRELKKLNKFHPSLMNHQYITPNACSTDTSTDALLMRLTPPSVNWNEEDDAALIKFTFGTVGLPQQIAYAMTLNTFDGIEESVLEGVVKETAESINEQLWSLMKEKMKNG